jgi:hypothetical protein
MCLGDSRGRGLLPGRGFSRYIGERERERDGGIRWRIRGLTSNTAIGGPEDRLVESRK